MRGGGTRDDFCLVVKHFRIAFESPPCNSFMLASSQCRQFAGFILCIGISGPEVPEQNLALVGQGIGRICFFEQAYCPVVETIAGQVAGAMPTEMADVERLVPFWEYFAPG